MAKVTETSPGNYEIDCDMCGKPITEANKYGMFCEDLCGLEESEKAYKAVKDFIKDLAGGLG